MNSLTYSISFFFCIIKTYVVQSNSKLILNTFVILTQQTECLFYYHLDAAKKQNLTVMRRFVGPHLAQAEIEWVTMGIDDGPVPFS